MVKLGERINTTYILAFYFCQNLSFIFYLNLTDINMVEVITTILSSLKVSEH